MGFEVIIETSLEESLEAFILEAVVLKGGTTEAQAICIGQLVIIRMV